MQCSCGAETVYQEHEVKNLAKAKEWYPHVESAPITICRDKCPACGRIELRPPKYIDAQKL